MKKAKLRFGFKAEADRIARDARLELGLTLYCRLDPRILADKLAIEIVGVDELAKGCRDPASAHRLLVEAPDEFSAATVFDGSRRIIVVNSSHAPARFASDVTHELAHVLLEHEPTVAVQGGTRDWSPIMEEEATWLGGCLLVSTEAALEIARAQRSVEEAAEFYGVSCPLMNWRLNQSGARLRVERERLRGGQHGRPGSRPPTGRS